MGFLVGNDFIPHLPDLHIKHEALPKLWKVYMEILPELGGAYQVVRHIAFVSLAQARSSSYGIRVHQRKRQLELAAFPEVHGRPGGFGAEDVLGQVRGSKVP
jgi:hypothetical protein